MREVENKENIYNLITLDFNGRLDKQQKEELQTWREISPEHDSEYLTVIKLLYMSDRLTKMKNIAADKDLMQVKKKLNSGTTMKRWLLNFQKIAAILILPLLIYTTWSSINLTEKNNKIALVMKSTETDFGVRSKIQLSDGTKVWLNSGSKLTYPEVFTGDSREVCLVGEGYFQVESDKDHPFYVDLNGYKVKATGTKFNISNYPGDKEITTYLERGKVLFHATGQGKQDEDIPLKERQIIILNKVDNKYQVKNSDGKKYLSWIDGLLILRKDSINELADKLGRWYNADIIFDEKIQRSGYVFTATFKQESLEEAMKLLSYSSPITYKIISGYQMKDSSFSRRKVIIAKK